MLFVWCCVFNIFHSIEQCITPYWAFLQKWCVLAWTPGFWMDSPPSTVSFVCLFVFCFLLSHYTLIQRFDSNDVSLLLSLPMELWYSTVISKYKSVPFSLYVKVLSTYIQIFLSLHQIYWIKATKDGIYMSTA